MNLKPRTRVLTLLPLLLILTGCPKESLKKFSDRLSQDEKEQFMKTKHVNCSIIRIHSVIRPRASLDRNTLDKKALGMVPVLPPKKEYDVFFRGWYNIPTSRDTPPDWTKFYARRQRLDDAANDCDNFTEYFYEVLVAQRVRQN